MIEIKMTFEDIGAALKAMACLNMTEAKVETAVDRALDSLQAQGEAPKARTTRKAKAEAHMEAGAGIAAAVAQTLAAPAPAPVAAPVAAPTKEECSAALIAYSQKHSKDAALAILKKYGAQNVSAVPVEKRAEFLVDCRA